MTVMVEVKSVNGFANFARQRERLALFRLHLADPFLKLGLSRQSGSCEYQEWTRSSERTRHNTIDRLLRLRHGTVVQRAS